MERNNYHHSNFIAKNSGIKIIYKIFGKVFGPIIKFLLILGSATEYILVSCRVHDLYWFQFWYMYSRYNHRDL